VPGCLRENPWTKKTKGLILEHALPDNLVQEYNLLQKTQNITFTGFVAKMNERFGRGQPMVAELSRLTFHTLAELKPKSSSFSKSSFQIRSRLSGTWAPKRLAEFYYASSVRRSVR
jgi:hypothetical protein